MLPQAVASGPDGPPPRLSATGLYADVAAKTVAAGVVPFSPQYPLWSDGAHKRRWISLPAGTAIDATDPDAWSFPVGTRLWKEFSFQRRVETRYMERTASGGWLFATYRWDEAETDAILAPDRGVRQVAESRPGVPYGLPGLVECRACHESGLTPVLGFSALQLSSDRDPGALHAAPPDSGSLDLDELLRRRLVEGLPTAVTTRPPRVGASGPTERAALGYLHANCSNCHNRRSTISGLDLSFTVRTDGTAEALATAVGRPSHYRPTGTEIDERIVPGDPASSLVIARVASRGTARQMPPMGTRLVDEQGLTLLTRWITELANAGAETPAASEQEEKP